MRDLFDTSQRIAWCAFFSAKCERRRGWPQKPLPHFHLLPVQAQLRDSILHLGLWRGINLKGPHLVADPGPARVAFRGQTGFRQPRAPPAHGREVFNLPLSFPGRVSALSCAPRHDGFERTASWRFARKWLMGFALIFLACVGGARARPCDCRLEGGDLSLELLVLVPQSRGRRILPSTRRPCTVASIKTSQHMAQGRPRERECETRCKARQMAARATCSSAMMTVGPMCFPKLTRCGNSGAEADGGKGWKWRWRRAT